MNTFLSPRLFVLAAMLPLVGGCAHPAGPGPANPAPAPAAAASATPVKPSAALTRPAATAPAPSTPGAAVTIGENVNNKTVSIHAGETLAIRLAVDESTGNRWFMLNRLEGGILEKKGNTTYAPTPAGTVATLLYLGLRPGTQELHFYYAPPDQRQNPTRAADFRVIVR